MTFTRINNGACVRLIFEDFVLAKMNFHYDFILGVSNVAIIFFMGQSKWLLSKEYIYIYNFWKTHVIKSNQKNILVIQGLVVEPNPRLQQKISYQYVFACEHDFVMVLAIVKFSAYLFMMLKGFCLVCIKLYIIHVEASFLGTMGLTFSI